jgi:ketosteroid isomerase-like protein
MRPASLFGLALLASACSPKSDAPSSAAPAVLSTAALDSVKDIDAAFTKGMNAKDTAAVFAIYAPGAKLMPPNSPVLQGDAIRSFIAGFIASGPSDFVLTPNTTYGVGDLAYVVGTATFKMNGAPDSVKYAEVLRRGNDGKWGYVVDMFSELTAPPIAAQPKKGVK